MRSAEFEDVTHRKTEQDLRYRPLHSLAEVSRYARVQPNRLRSWSKPGDNTLVEPAGHNTVAPLSFINLIETHVLLALRRAHMVPMGRIRTAIEWLKDKYHSEHPLAELDLETDGYDVFVKESGLPVSASRKGQIGIPVRVTFCLT